MRKLVPQFNGKMMKAGGIVMMQIGGKDILGTEPTDLETT